MVRHEDLSSVALFVIVGIVVGSVMDFVLKYVKIPIPYTVMVFFVGIVYSVSSKAANQPPPKYVNDNTVAADLIIYVFLPALLFNETMNLNWLHIKQGFAQATLLAIPGGVVVATLLAICAYYVMPFHWSLTYSFLFGAILCATDPVSVVDLLKRTGASSKLSTVIAGESLLNDGSAMILYFFVLNLLKGKTYTAATFLEFIARMLILSPAIGFVSGFIAYALMRKLIHPTNLNMDAQIALSFVCAYVSFYVAEGLADVSGVLACCTAGVTLALFVNPQVLYHDRMHMIWHYAEWVCNTLIFLLGGLIGGDHAGNLATLNNIGYVVAMYALVQGTRMVMVGLFYPVVSRIGMKCSFNDALFMSFAGLRGALAIALALDSTTQADDFGDHYTGEQIFFVVTGVVSMTLLINGSAAGYVLFMLGLVDDPNSPVSPQKQQVLDRIKDFLRKLVRQEIGSITNFGDYDETEVMRLCRIMVTEGKNLLVTEEEIEMDRERNISRSMSRISGADVDDDLLTFLRSTYLDIVRARYIESIKTGKIGSSSTASKLLIYSVDAAIDTVRIGIYDWDVIERNLTTNKLLLRTAIIVDDISYFCGRPTAYTAYLDALYERIAIYVLTNYIEAHEYAMNKVHYYLGADDGNFDIAGPEERILLSQSNSVITKAKFHLESINQEDILRINTFRAAKGIIIKQLEILHRMMEEGALSEKLAHHLFQTVEDDRKLINVERESYDRSLIRESASRKQKEEQEMRDSLSKLSPAAQAAMLDTDTGVRSSLRVSLMGEDMRKSSFIYRRTPNSSSTQDIANAIEVAEQSTNSSIVSGSPVAAKNPLLHKNNPDV